MEYPPGWTCEVVTLRLEYYISSSLPRGEALAMLSMSKRALHVRTAWCS